MIVSNSHLKATVATGTKSGKICDNVCIILIDIVATWINMVYIKTATAWTAFCPAILANFVTIIYKLTDMFPVASVLQTFTTTPMRAVLPGHVFNGAFAGTILAPITCLGREDIKRLAAILTGKRWMDSYTATVRAFRGAMFNSGSFLIKEFSTIFTVDICHLRSAPFQVAFSRTKNILGVLAYSIGLAFKRLATLEAYFEHN